MASGVATTRPAFELVSCNEYYLNLRAAINYRYDKYVSVVGA